MKLNEVLEKVESLKTSSAFRSGDPTAFGVRILPLEAELPGPCSPKDYLDLIKRKLGITIKKGDRVMVVGAANGGLCAEALLAGASEVLAVEPRFRYGAAVDQIIRLLDEVYPEPVCRTYRGWPTTAAVDGLGRFDLVLWPESIDECQRPVETFTAILQMLKADGQAAIEVTHGDMGVPQGKTNAFFPTESAWLQMVTGLTGAGPNAAVVGRAARRMIYGFGRSKSVGTVEPTPDRGLPPFPKDPPTLGNNEETEIKPEPTDLETGLPVFPKDAPKPEETSEAFVTPEPAPGLPAFPKDAPISAPHRVGTNLPPVEEPPTEPEASLEDAPVEESLPVSLPEEPAEESIPLSLPDPTSEEPASDEQ